MSDVSKTNGDLIKRARGLAAHSYGGVSRTLRELTDALEAVTSVPVQGEPNGDREVLAELVQRFEECDNPDYLLADFLLSQGVGFSRATVPDAATEGRLTQAELEDIAETHAFCADRLFIETELVDEIRAERDAALAAVERVRAIHKVKHGERPVWALGGIQGIHKPTRFEKYSMCEGCSATWPCRTVAALDGAPEPEVKP